MGGHGFGGRDPGWRRLVAVATTELQRYMDDPTTIVPKGEYNVVFTCPATAHLDIRQQAIHDALLAGDPESVHRLTTVIVGVAPSPTRGAFHCLDQPADVLVLVLAEWQRPLLQVAGGLTALEVATARSQQFHTAILADYAPSGATCRPAC